MRSGRVRGGRFVAEDDPDVIELNFGHIGNAAAQHVKFTMAAMHWYRRRVRE
jgi:hypothetical protein